jgi:3-oxoacyl-[acyl-carrier protein] reductase
MNADLKDKVVLITGASGGIGASAARQFAAEGVKLILHFNSRKTEAENLRRELARTECILLRADLTRETEVVDLFTQARSAFGKIDSLVANAGIWVEEDLPIQEMSLTQWQRTMDADLTATFLCCREFFKIVQVQQRGNVVLVGSTAGIFGEAGHVDYSAAKSAMAYGLTRTLKNEISRIAPHTAEYCGGRVNCVCPGWTVTPLTEKHLGNETLVRRVIATMALPQIARPEDIANPIVFLASDTLARHITGQTLVVAGGMEGRLLWNEKEVDVGKV